MGTIKNDTDYQEACARYEQIKDAAANDAEHVEKMLLVNEIVAYEESIWDLPEPVTGGKFDESKF